MSKKLVKQGGKLLKKDGKLVTSEGGCDCCGPPPDPCILGNCIWLAPVCVSSGQVAECYGILPATPPLQAIAAQCATGTYPYDCRDKQACEEYLQNNPPPCCPGSPYKLTWTDGFPGGEGDGIPWDGVSTPYGNEETCCGVPGTCCNYGAGTAVQERLQPGGVGPQPGWVALETGPKKSAEWLLTDDMGGPTYAPPGLPPGPYTNFNPRNWQLVMSCIRPPPHVLFVTGCCQVFGVPVNLDAPVTSPGGLVPYSGSQWDGLGCREFEMVASNVPAGKATVCYDCSGPSVSKVVLPEVTLVNNPLP